MVAREAVFNAVLHGSPALVDVSLAYGNSDLTLRVRDNGCGFDPDPMSKPQGHHFGLRGMKERIERSGGTFHLDTAPGKGVSVAARLLRNGNSAY